MLRYAEHGALADTQVPALRPTMCVRHCVGQVTTMRGCQKQPCPLLPPLPTACAHVFDSTSHLRCRWRCPTASKPCATWLFTWGTSLALWWESPPGRMGARQGLAMWRTAAGCSSSHAAAPQPLDLDLATHCWWHTWAALLVVMRGVHGSLALKVPSWQHTVWHDVATTQR